MHVDGNFVLPDYNELTAGYSKLLTAVLKGSGTLALRRVSGFLALRQQVLPLLATPQEFCSFFAPIATLSKADREERPCR